MTTMTNCPTISKESRSISLAEKSKNNNLSNVIFKDTKSNIYFLVTTLSPPISIKTQQSLTSINLNT